MEWLAQVSQCKVVQASGWWCGSTALSLPLGEQPAQALPVLVTHTRNGQGFCGGCLDSQSSTFQEHVFKDNYFDSSF